MRRWVLDYLADNKLVATCLYMCSMYTFACLFVKTGPSHQSRESLCLTWYAISGCKLALMAAMEQALLTSKVGINLSAKSGYYHVVSSSAVAC